MAGRSLKPKSWKSCCPRLDITDVKAGLQYLILEKNIQISNIKYHLRSCTVGINFNALINMVVWFFFETENSTKNLSQKFICH